MPVLPNPRHELFAQELAKGKSQIAAYVDAGYKRDDGASARMAVKVKERVAELLAEAAKETVVTVGDIARQLDEDRQFARECEVPGAAVSATMGKAKVLGLIVEKQEVKQEVVMPQLDDTELARRIAFALAKGQRASPAPGE